MHGEQNINKELLCSSPKRTGIFSILPIGLILGPWKYHSSWLLKQLALRLKQPEREAPIMSITTQALWNNFQYAVVSYEENNVENKFLKKNAVASKVFITGILKRFQFTDFPASYLHFIQIFRTSVNTTRNATDKCIYRYTACPTRYRTRHFFNNFTSNEDIAAKYEADLHHCVRNVTTS